MNIFHLDNDPVIAAQMMCDKHIPKMIVEAAQMLSTAHRMLDGTMMRRPSKSGKRMVNYYELPDPHLDEVVYNAVHFNHPSTVWTRESKDNYQWHYKHFLTLCDEFVFRFGKQHLTYEKLSDILSVSPTNIPDIGLTRFKCAMSAYPDLLKLPDPVQSYRAFYKVDKAKFAKWEKVVKHQPGGLSNG